MIRGSGGNRIGHVPDTVVRATSLAWEFANEIRCGKGIVEMKRVSRIAVGALVCGAALLSAVPAQAETAAPAPVAAQDVAFNTGSAVADTVINGLITIIFGPNDDPRVCKFPYCF